MRWLLGAVTTFVLFDFVLHLFESFGIYLFSFPSQQAYNLFWTIGWGVVVVILLAVVATWRRV